MTEIEKENYLASVTHNRKICNGIGIDIGETPKLQYLLKLLDCINEKNEKVIVSAHYTQTLDIVQNLIQNKHSFFRIDGKVTAATRQYIVNTFNENGTCVLLLSTKSAGEGFNILGANHLVLLDNDFNPSIESQLFGRVWRKGQTRTVYIYRMVVVQSIEEEILIKQFFKTKLSESVLNSTQSGDNKSHLLNHFHLKESVEFSHSFEGWTVSTNCSYIPSNLTGPIFYMFKN